MTVNRQNYSPIDTLIHVRREELSVAREQDPMWGIGRRQNSSSEKGRERKLPDLSFRPKPHLGACSQ